MNAPSLAAILGVLTAVVIVGRLLGGVARRFGQPRVLGEILSGVLLGPSALGAVAPEVYAAVFAPAVVAHVGTVAQLGVVLYMFLVGLELNASGKRTHAMVFISHTSIIVPFLLGSLLAFWLYDPFSPPSVPFLSFALFMGVAMSITAFPVLARILEELRMSQSPFGTLALTCAAVDDITAWCLLALVTGFVQTTTSAAVVVTVLAIVFVIVMLTAGHRAANWLARRTEVDGPRPEDLAIVAIALLLVATGAEAIGVHALFGAFMMGVAIPSDSRLARELVTRFEAPVTILLLPAFFAFAGLRTDIGLLSGWAPWLACLAIVLVATIGKVGGAMLGARVSGLSWGAAAAIGALMNTRGLMQLVVLNVGLDLGVITPTMFTMMVVMALVTTAATTPAVRRLGRFVDDDVAVEQFRVPGSELQVSSFAKAPVRPRRSASRGGGRVHGSGS